MDNNLLRQTVRDSQAIRIACRGVEDGAFCLIVEDDRDASTLLENILFTHNYNSKSVNTIEDAISTIHEEQKKVMCAIIDLHMGADDGVEVLREIERSAPEIPCIIYTGDTKAGAIAHEQFPRANVVMKGSSMYALLSAFGFTYDGKETA